MMPEPAQSVKLLAGILYSDQEILDHALKKLETYFGNIDYKSQLFEFNTTKYYCDEMGSTIFRFFITFSELINPEKLAKIKLITNEIENNLKLENCRKVNIDCGYMDYDKVVLASCKYNGQKIYIGQGIWADLTLHYSKGQFKPYPWSFPDFKEDVYQSTFLNIRQTYKNQMKSHQ